MIMNISFTKSPCHFIDDQEIEIVERKGLGHPDTLADGVADAISYKYSNYCLKNFVCSRCYLGHTSAIDLSPCFSCLNFHFKQNFSGPGLVPLFLKARPCTLPKLWKTSQGQTLHLPCTFCPVSRSGLVPFVLSIKNAQKR